MIVQKTISKPVTLSGNGLHTGKYCEVTICPANENTGIVFVRTDIENQPEIKAIPKNLSSFDRSTTITSDNISAITIEHFMASFHLLGIDNLKIMITSAELPILDGSAKPIVNALKPLIVKQQAEKPIIKINKQFAYIDTKTDSWIKVEPADEFSAEVTINFRQPIGKHTVTYNTGDNVEAIASSRTFVFLSELSYLRTHGLIKGGSIDNALVFADISLSNEEKNSLEELFNCSGIEVTPNHTLNNTTFRNAEEPAYHKLLDLLGDLAVLGKPLCGKITAYKPGHGANAAFVKMFDEHLLTH